MFGEDFRTRQRQPVAEASVLTADLEELKATFYLLSLQTKESLNLQQDAVVLNLAPRAPLTRFQGQPENTEPEINDIYGWADLIEPNDIITVKLYDAALNWDADNEHLKNYSLYLVDRVSVRMGYSEGSKVQRVITVMGRGFGKLFTEHTLARFPSITGAYSEEKKPVMGEEGHEGETEEDFKVRYAKSVKGQALAARTLGIIPSIVGDLTATLFLFRLLGRLDTILDTILRPGVETEGITDGTPLIFGNAMMKLRYGRAKDEEGKPVYIKLHELFDLTGNIDVRLGDGIAMVDATGVQGQEMGPILGLLRALAAPPFYEIFMQTVPLKDDPLGIGMVAHLCVRTSPFDSINSGTDYTPNSTKRYGDSGWDTTENAPNLERSKQSVYQPFWYINDYNVPTINPGEKPYIHKIKAWEIINSDIGRSDADTFTFFQSKANTIAEWGPILDAIIPGFFPGPFPDFSGGTGGTEYTNAEGSAWVEAHRQIQDRNGPDGQGGIKLLDALATEGVEAENANVNDAFLSKIIFDPEKDVGATHRFGVKLMQVQNRFVPDVREESDEPITEAEGLTLLFRQSRLLTDWFSMNPHYMSGKLVIAGRAEIWKGNWVEADISASGHSGQVLTYEGGKQERKIRFYVEQVEQAWMFGGIWTTTLTVTRGEYVILD